MNTQGSSSAEMMNDDNLAVTVIKDGMGGTSQQGRPLSTDSTTITPNELPSDVSPNMRAAFDQLDRDQQQQALKAYTQYKFEQQQQQQSQEFPAITPDDLPTEMRAAFDQLDAEQQRQALEILLTQQQQLLVEQQAKQTQAHEQEAQGMDTPEIPNFSMPRPRIEENNPCDNSDYDTLGLHYTDIPQEGGVLPNAERSVGGVSGITTPRYFVPLNQIKVPLPLHENGPNDVDVGGSQSSIDAYNNSGFADIDNTTATSSSEESRKKAAKKNLQDGLAASGNAEFDTAALHFAAGREQLGSGGWKSDFDLMLKLCSEGANASFIAGDFDTMNIILNEITSKDNITIKDKFRAYEVKMLSEHASGNYLEALELGLEVRRQLGLYAPPNKPASTLRIVVEFIRTNHALGKRTTEELANLQEQTDERINMGMRMLDLMGNASFSVQPTMFPIITCLLFRETLKYGINASSPNALAGFGILLCSFGKPQRGRDMAVAAELILAKPDMAQSKSRSIYLCEGLINHWTLPLRGTLAPLFEGYTIGLEMGNVQDASLNQCFHVIHTFYAGCPLKEDILAEMIALQVGLQNDVETFAGLSEGDSRLDIHLAIHMHHLAAAKLRGVKLEESEMMNFDGILKYTIDTGNRALRAYVFIVQVELCVFFGEWQAATDLLLEAGELLPDFVGLFQGVRYIYVSTLVYLKTAKSSVGIALKKKWKKSALKKMKLIRGWVKKGSVNCVHNLHLLEAELAILDGNNKTAEGMYKLAIDVASKNGFLHDQAITHELASLYFKCRGDQHQREYHIEHAIKCYSEWGAMAKVEQLTE